MLNSPIASGPRALLTAAALIIVLAGLRAASPIFGPVLFGLFLAMLVLTSMRTIKRMGRGELSNTVIACGRPLSST